MGYRKLSARRGLAALLAVTVGAGLSLPRAAGGEEGAKASPAKYAIELPTKAAVRGRSSPAPDNPHVEPGLVRWHPTFEAACAASRKSGKPVLLFQMMGKLDDQFC